MADGLVAGSGIKHVHIKPKARNLPCTGSSTIPPPVCRLRAADTHRHHCLRTGHASPRQVEGLVALRPILTDRLPPVPNQPAQDPASAGLIGHLNCQD